jgi:hypothetical protein
MMFTIVYDSVPLPLLLSLLENSWVDLIQHLKVTCVLYGCKIWSVMLREEHRQRMFVEKMVVMTIFGPKREELAVG